MQFGDLMPGRIPGSGSEAGGDQRHKPRKWLSARDALETLDHESLVVSIIGSDFLAHQDIDEETWARLAVAVNRVNKTRAAYAAARVGR